MSSTNLTSSTATPTSHPVHLDPSELGTKEYWDAHYTDDLDLQNQNHDGSTSPSPPPSPSDLTSWFDDVDAPARTLAFLTSSTFPLSPNYAHNDDGREVGAPSILDLGTGNGSTLFQLRRSGAFTGPMLGVDYSPQSIQLARTLAQCYASGRKEPPTTTKPPRCSAAAADDTNTIQFHVLDLIHSDPAAQAWWPGAFDLVLDKGTFDAISLSSETVTVTAPDDGGTTQRHVCEVYPAKVAAMVKPDGFLLVTSCNWTQDEVVHWFTITTTTAAAALASKEGSAAVVAQPLFEVWGTVKYPRYQFGGQEGQGVAGVCFRRVG